MSFGALPREVLELILASCPDLQTALRLVSANGRFRSIWLDQTSQSKIITAVLRNRVLALDEAIKSAVLEIILASKGGSHMTKAQIQAQPRQWLPVVLSNAERASSTCTQYLEHRQENPMPIWTRFPRRLTPTTCHIAYYIIRQMVVAYRESCQEELACLHRSSKTFSAELLRTIFDLVYFMSQQMDDEERERHDIPEDKEEYYLEYEISQNVVKDEWSNTLEYFRTLLDDIEPSESDSDCGGTSTS